MKVNRIGAYKDSVLTMLDDFTDTRKIVRIKTARSGITGILGKTTLITDENAIYFVEKEIPEYKTIARVHFSIDDIVQITVKERYVKEGDNYVIIVQITIDLNKFI